MSCFTYWHEIEAFSETVLTALYDYHQLTDIDVKMIQSNTFLNHHAVSQHIFFCSYGWWISNPAQEKHQTYLDVAVKVTISVWLLWLQGRVRMCVLENKEHKTVIHGQTFCLSRFLSFLCCYAALLKVLCEKDDLTLVVLILLPE